MVRKQNPEQKLIKIPLKSWQLLWVTTKVFFAYLKISTFLLKTPSQILKIDF